MTEYLNSQGLLETYIGSPECLKERCYSVSASIVPECQGVSTSKNKKSYAPYNIEYVKWLRFDVEQNAPESPFWHSTLESHIPGICASQWVLEGREIITLNADYMANSIEAGVQAGDRGSGNELLVFMGTMTVAQQYLACDKDETGRMTYNLYMLNIVPDKIKRFYPGMDDVHTHRTAHASSGSLFDSFV